MAQMAQMAKIANFCKIANIAEIARIARNDMIAEIEKVRLLKTSKIWVFSEKIIGFFEKKLFFENR